MTDRRRTPAGTASRVLVTGASIAAGLGLIGVMEASAGAIETQVGEAAGPIGVIRRVVVVPITQPDIVLHAAGSSGAQVIRQEAPAPIIRVRPAPAGGGSTVAPAQTTSSGS